MEMTLELSEREEMYLVTIAQLMETGQAEPVPLSLISNQLEIASVSANQMIRRLEEAELVCYTPYKGASLTNNGMQRALRILRHRRLWEFFLVKHLHFTLVEASKLACRLEHTLPCEAAERLADFLGNPTLSPGGLPIPEENACTPPVGQVCLADLNLNQDGLVTEILADPVTRAFLETQGVYPGQALRILASATSGDLLVRTQPAQMINLSPELATQIRVIPRTSL